MEIVEVSRTMHLVKINKMKKSGERHTTLFCSDVHFDSVNCNRELLARHFDKADSIFIDGDWFDLMQGQYDPRRNYSDVRPEYMGGNYLDLVIKDSLEWLAPYINKIIGFGHGNHETKIIKHLNTDPLDNLVALLNYKHGCNIKLMGYSGWLLFQLERNSDRKTFKVKYHHGTRSNARRSKGVLQVDIDAMKWPDADIIIKGDDHQKWHYPAVVRERLYTNAGAYHVRKDVQHQIRLGSYKDGVQDGYMGWEVEKGFNELKLGGWFIDWYQHNHKFNYQITEAN